MILWEDEEVRGVKIRRINHTRAFHHRGNLLGSIMYMIICYGYVKDSLPLLSSLTVLD